jgi:hypothetical protein
MCIDVRGFTLLADDVHRGVLSEAPSPTVLEKAMHECKLIYDENEDNYIRRQKYHLQDDVGGQVAHDADATTEGQPK